MYIQKLFSFRIFLLVILLSGLLTGCSTTSYGAVSENSEVAIHAMSVIDTHYKYGGNAPETGLDCSGLVRYVYKKAWGVELPRTSAEISKMGESVSRHNLVPGDLVFYNIRRRRNSHVGIYVGNNQFIHAPSSGGKVRLDSMSAQYWQARFNGARRLVNPLHKQSETEEILQAFKRDADTLDN